MTLKRSSTSCLVVSEEEESGSTRLAGYPAGKGRKTRLDRAGPQSLQDWRGLRPAICEGRGAIWDRVSDVDMLDLISF